MHCHRIVRLFLRGQPWSHVAPWRFSLPCRFFWHLTVCFGCHAGNHDHTWPPGLVVITLLRFFRGFFWPSCCCCPRKWQRTFILVSGVVRPCSFPTILFFYGIPSTPRYSHVHLHEGRATQAANKQYHFKWNSPPTETVNAHVLPIN